VPFSQGAASFLLNLILDWQRAAENNFVFGVLFFAYKGIYEKL
jgi:hypothetical protein